MAGHSQFKNIMHRKGAQDAKRARLFARLGREIMVAARNGADLSTNPRLRSAVAAARAANMPKDNVERAIKKAIGGEDNTQYEEITYEGYGPGGTAIIVEALTDNRNRTASEVRAAFAKSGGNLGETGSVRFMFDRVGIFRLPRSVGDFDTVFEKAVEAGAQDVEELEDAYEIITEVDQFAAVRDQLNSTWLDQCEAQLAWRPENTVQCDRENAQKIIKLWDALEDNDDVQNVYGNFEISEEDLLNA